MVGGRNLGVMGLDVHQVLKRPGVLRGLRLRHRGLLRQQVFLQRSGRRLDHPGVVIFRTGRLRLRRRSIINWLGFIRRRQRRPIHARDVQLQGVILQRATSFGIQTTRGGSSTSIAHSVFAAILLVQVLHHPNDVAFTQPQRAQQLGRDVFQDVFVHTFLTEVKGVALAVANVDATQKEEFKPIVVAFSWSGVGQRAPMVGSLWLRRRDIVDGSSGRGAVVTTRQQLPAKCPVALFVGADHFFLVQFQQRTSNLFYVLQVFHG